jgi:hypothetical protein
MTLIGKFLALLNLLVGIGLVTWSVSLYVSTPTWFDEIPESVSPGHNPRIFKQLQADITQLGNTAKAASSAWGAQLKIVEDLQARRADRLKKFAERLKWARVGKPDAEKPDLNGCGFFEPVYDKSTGLIDLTKRGDPILGPNNKPLRGSDTLMTNYSADVEEVARLSKLIVKQREAFQALSPVVLEKETELLKMGEIRDAVQSELFYLSSFEVNVYETRETVLRRKKQLAGRLADLK